MTPMKAIRAKCLDCCCGQVNEVRHCPVNACTLHPFRFGKNPHRAGIQNNGAFVKNAAQRTILSLQLLPRVITYLTRQKGKNAMYRPMRQNKPRRVIHDVAELPVLCDCAEAGLLLRRNPEVIAKMAKEGVLKGAKQGQSWFFRRDDLVEYMDKLFGTGGTGT